MRGLPGFAAASGLLGLIACAGGAQAGFFDDLFGLFFRPPPYRIYSAPAPRRHSWAHNPGKRTSEHKKTNLAKTPAPLMGPQKPVGIMEDETLRKGDAVVTENGIRIFAGAPGPHHEPRDFKKPTEIRRLSKTERKAFAALEVKTPMAGDSNKTVSGRSAAEPSSNADRLVPGPEGRLIRYVGP
ncbi:MAG: hypothetical protein J2P49_10865 [Methylocapsa sp.]|nr:hypothetical protein [Methylocapsa sp.]